MGSLHGDVLWLPFDLLASWLKGSSYDRMVAVRYSPQDISEVLIDKAGSIRQRRNAHANHFRIGIAFFKFHPCCLRW